jgi:hypothetical protein
MALYHSIYHFSVLGAIVRKTTAKKYRDELNARPSCVQARSYRPT